MIENQRKKIILNVLDIINAHNNNILHTLADKNIKKEENELFFTIEANGKNYYIIADKNHKINIKLNGNEDGSLIFIGNADGNIFREGKGNGHAIKSGNGNGNVSRRDDGNGHAIQIGSGYSNVNRIGNGTGSAIKINYPLKNKEDEKNNSGQTMKSGDSNGHAISIGPNEGDAILYSKGIATGYSVKMGLGRGNSKFIYIKNNSKKEKLKGAAIRIKSDLNSSISRSFYIKKNQSS